MMHLPLLRYGVAVLSVTAAVLLKLLLDPLIPGKQNPFLLFFAAVMVSAWYGGLKVGLLATALAALASDYFFVSPMPSLLTNGLEDNLKLSLFVLEGVAINWFAEAAQTAKSSKEAIACQQPKDINACDRHPSAEALRKSEQRYQDLADAMPLIVWTAQPDGALDYYNRRWFDYTGMTLEQTKGWGWQPVLHPDDLQQCLDRWNEAVSTSKPYETEYRFKRHDGMYRWHLGRALPMRDRDGRIVSWAGTCTDIDDQKRTREAERLLVEASSLFASSLDDRTALTNAARLLVPHIADWCAVDIADDNTICRLTAVRADPLKVEWTRELQKRYPPHPDDRYGVPEVLRTGKSELYPEAPDEILVATARDAEHLAMLRQEGFRSAIVVPMPIVRGRSIGAITLVSASGRRYTTSDLAFAEELARRAGLAVDNARLFASVEQELANRVQIETALRESEERFRTMADSAPVLLWVAGLDAVCNFFNQSWLAFRGRTLEQEMGNGWVEGVHPDDRQRCFDTYMAAFDLRQSFEREYRLLRADGEYRWLFDRGTPRFMPDRSFVGYIGSCTDITDRKSSEEALRDRVGELARVSAVLAQTNATLEKRNSELDQFAYVVSHDLKAPLRAIANLSTWIEEDIEDQLTGETRHQMDLLRGRVHRMEALINGLLQYSRIGRVKTPAELVNVETSIANVIECLSLPPEFTITVANQMPELHTERKALEQVFSHLISNAIEHHHRRDGRVTISSQDKGDFYEFALADDGPGIDPQYHKKVFVMFQTLEARDKVENTGVGLALVKKIIENQGGTIRLESQLGQGATFYFTWPKFNKIK